MYEITLYGQASQKTFKFYWDKTNTSTLQQSLLNYLTSNDLPIAHSCYSKGVCQKCKVKVNDKELLSCQLYMKDLEDGAIIKVSYL